MRKAAGLSQSELAERIGVKQSRISEIESGVGTQGPTWEVMERIAAAFGQNLGIAAGPGNPYGIPFQNINTVDPGMTVEPGMWELAAGAQSTSGQHPKRGQQQRRLSEQDVSEVVRQLAPLLPQILMQIVRGPPGAFGAFGHGYGHPFGYGYGPAGFGQPLYPLAGLAGLETLCGLSGWPHQAGLGGSQNWGAQFRRQLTPQDAHEIVSQLTAVISNLQRRT
jgi:transcriptional regulator with XRE-family HTH domain